MTTRVTAIVVTWNSRDSIAPVLSSVDPDVDLVVVDNASDDGTADEVERLYPRATVVRNSTNRGFAAAVNQGAAAAATEFILLLNPDAELTQGALAALLRFADSQPKAGAVSALVVDRRGRPERFSGGAQPSLLSVAVHELGLTSLFRSHSLYGVHATPASMEMGWVAGTAVLIRREAFVAVGGLDERYFLYCEDMDLCRRLQHAGWETWLCPEGRAVHGRSIAVAKAGSWVDSYRLGSLDRYYAGQARLASLAIFRLVRLAGAALRALVFTAAGIILRRKAMRDRGAARARDASILGRMAMGGR